MKRKTKLIPNRIEPKYNLPKGNSIEKQLGNKLLFCIYNKSDKEIDLYKHKYFNHLSKVVKDKTDMDLFNRIGDRLRNYYKEKMREDLQ